MRNNATIANVRSEIEEVKDDILKWTDTVSDVQTKFDKVAKDFRAIHRASDGIKEKTEKLDEFENQQTNKEEK